MYKTSNFTQPCSKSHEKIKRAKILKKKSHHELRNLPLNFTEECIKYPFLFSLLKSIDQSIGCHWGEFAQTQQQKS